MPVACSLLPLPTRGPPSTFSLLYSADASPDLARILENLHDARLLTLNSFGHTSSYGGLSRCIDAAVDHYLVEAKLPPKGKVCQPDRGPFPASP